LRTGFFELQVARDTYRFNVGQQMNKQLVMRFIEVQALLLCPITPHWSEHIWKLLGHAESIRKSIMAT